MRREDRHSRHLTNVIGNIQHIFINPLITQLEEGILK